MSVSVGRHDLDADAERPARDVQPEPGQADQRGQPESTEQVGPPAESPKPDARRPEYRCATTGTAQGAPGEQLEDDGEVQPEVDEVDRGAGARLSATLLARQAEDARPRSRLSSAV